MFPETTTHFESLLSRIKAASKERQRERRRTTTNALRLSRVGGWVSVVGPLGVKRLLHAQFFIIVVAFFYLVFFLYLSSMVFFLFLFLSQKKTVEYQKRGARVKKVPNHENPKLRSETKEAHEETKSSKCGLKEKLF